jgi:spermidine/putrescine transport system permease protein
LVILPFGVTLSFAPSDMVLRGDVGLTIHLLGDCHRLGPCLSAYAILTCYISLQSIDDSLIEAARSLGASPLQAFLRLTLPLSTPGIVAGVILIFVPVIGSFMEPRILGGKNAIMLGPLIENQFTAVFNWSLGAALSFIILAIVLLILLAASPFLRRQLQ